MLLKLIACNVFMREACLCIARSPHVIDVDFLELGTGGLALLHALAGRETALILDCARMGSAPGALRRFTPDTVRAGGAPGSLSLHEGNVLELIALARSVGECPPQVVIFGIQPETIAPGEAVSPALQARLPGYLDVIVQELNMQNCSRADRLARARTSA